MEKSESVDDIVEIYSAWIIGGMKLDKELKGDARLTGMLILLNAYIKMLL